MLLNYLLREQKNKRNIESQDGQCNGQILFTIQDQGTLSHDKIFLCMKHYDTVSTEIPSNNSFDFLANLIST